MLGRHVPRGGSRVVDLNLGGGRNLYYLPKDVLQVIALNPKGSSQVLENQGQQCNRPLWPTIWPESRFQAVPDGSKQFVRCLCTFLRYMKEKPDNSCVYCRWPGDGLSILLHLISSAHMMPVPVPHSAL